MKISSGIIGMESSRNYYASDVTVTRYGIAQRREGSGSAGSGASLAYSDQNEGKQEKNSVLGKSAVGIWTSQSRYTLSADRAGIRSAASRVALEIREVTVRYIFELLFGSRKGRFGIEAWSVESSSILEGKELTYTREHWHMEEENTSFSTVGTVVTSDGRRLNFQVEVNMSREFSQYYRDEYQISTAQLCDPLVINLDTDAAQLSDQKFFFDIDADGEMDKISSLGSGSGYLALDKNGDGVINDGSELFGTASGDGFRDLARYDQDGNGWIDENDAIWSRLQIWCRDENGEDVLYRLADKGVGAVCLQNVSTDFALKGQDNQTMGVIRSTGIFLYENGMAGTIQHVDVAKYEMKA